MLPDIAMDRSRTLTTHHAPNRFRTSRGATSSARARRSRCFLAEVHCFGMAGLTMCLLILGGCATGGPLGVRSSTPAKVGGSVYGGQQPVAGAVVQLYAAGTAGAGSAATPLLSQPVTTDSNGGFDITGLYSCPSAATQVYITGTGGNPGLSSPAKNPEIALTSFLGNCGDLSSRSFVAINEVTTVASVWPLGAYMNSVSSLGSTPDDPSFVQAASLIEQTVDMSRGTAPGLTLPANYAVQTGKLNLLADALASCVNSPGGTAGDGSPCGTLFTLATPSGAVSPTDTVSAALAFARNPGLNLLPLYQFVPPIVPFAPTLTRVPANWALNLVAIPAPPDIYPVSGTYPAGQTVALTTGTGGASIQYTTDGSAPTAGSPTYSSSLLLSGNETVRAMATIEGISSAVSSAQYVVTPAHLAFNTPPVGAVAGGILNPPPSVTLVDSSGVPLYSGSNVVSISLGFNPGSANLGGTLSLPLNSGAATFSDLSVVAPGTGYVLVASSPGLPTVNSAPFTVTQPGLRLALPASSVTVGQTIGGTVTLDLPAARALTVSIASSSPSCVRVSATSVTVAAGATSASFTLTGVAAGSASINASALNYVSASALVTATAAAIPATLRQAALQRGLLVGAAAVADEFGFVDPLTADPLYASTLAAQYNMVEPETAMKWIVNHPAAGTYNFEPGDEILSFAQAHQMKVRGHNLCWGVANPQWLTDLAATNPSALSQQLHDHIFAVMTHYKGAVFAWDVVNEAIDDQATSSGTRMKDSIWYNQPGIGLSGTGFVEQAFRWAREADPAALLFYNEYLVYGPSPKFSAMYNMLSDFVARGVPIDGVGLQLHIGANGWPDSDGLTGAIQQITALGLQVHITELDVELPVDSAGVAAAPDLAAQAATYARILNVCLQNPRCTAFQTWGFSDKHSWVPGSNPGMGAALPFDMNYGPKPAFTSLLGVLNGGGAQHAVKTAK